eukprot:8629442-Alexandrium_andersonii.AAC.1
MTRCPRRSPQSTQGLSALQSTSTPADLDRTIYDHDNRESSRRGSAPWTPPRSASNAPAGLHRRRIR